MRGLLLLCLGVLLLGCEQRERPGLIEHASFGIFFGGQIQEREEIPFQLDRTKQRQGFRIDFHEPLAEAQPVRWEIDRPGPRGKGRKVVLGEATARAGQRAFEQELPFQPGDPVGTWNVRVTVGDLAAIDRPVLVYDTQARRRAKAEEEKAEDERK
jgi:hypothetical protein